MIGGIDRIAPPEFRPFWTMTRKGNKNIRSSYVLEAKERIKTGYRFMHAVREGSINWLAQDLAYMATKGTMPTGAGFGNEWDMERKMPLDVYAKKLRQIKGVLLGLRDQYDIMVSPPAFASFDNIAEGYGEEFRKVFGGENNVYVRVHNYHKVKPPMWRQHNVKAATLELCGMPDDGLVLVEEFGWDFSREHEEAKESVYGDRGADFYAKGLEGSVENGLPIQPFMNYLEKHGYNSMSDSRYGKMRWNVGRAFFKAARR